MSLERLRLSMFPDANGWSEEDYRTLVECALDGYFRAEHWLLFATIESGLNPKAMSRYAPAKGLWQAMPFVLKNLGFVPGNADYGACGGEFRNLGISSQVQWSLKYLDAWRKQYKFRSWARPGDLYLCNFAPAFLPYKDLPSKVIFSYAKDPKTYWVNRGLDRPQKGYKSQVFDPPAPYNKDAYDKDGKLIRRKDGPYTGKGFINVADMSLVLVASAMTSQYRQALRSLNKLLQVGLNQLDLGQPKLVVDGDVGPKTNAALAKFWELKKFPLEDRELSATTRLALMP